jgi:hypothetical protein
MLEKICWPRAVDADCIALIAGAPVIEEPDCKTLAILSLADATVLVAEVAAEAIVDDAGMGGASRRMNPVNRIMSCA